jgi:hypothetical protein
MTDNYKAEIEVLDERITVNFERPGVITRSRLIGQIPENLSRIADEVEDEEELEGIGLESLETADIEWMHEVIRESTDIPDEVVDDLPVETFMNMVEPAVSMITDDPPEKVTVDQPPNDSEYQVKEVKEKL